MAVVVVCVFGVVGLLLLSGMAVYFQHQKVALLSKPPSHGAVFVVEADLSQANGNSNALPDLKETIRRRFAKFGFSMYCESLSASRFRVFAPITDSKTVSAAKSMISQGGHLEFRLVHTNSDELVRNGDAPADYELLQHQESQPSGQTQIEKVLVKKQAEAGLAGNIVKNARVVRDPMEQPQINFELNPDSALAFAQVTRTNIGHRLAIVLDGQLYSAPTIQNIIATGNGQISGRFDDTEARLLAVLMDFPLPISTTLVESKTF